MRWGSESFCLIVLLWGVAAQSAAHDPKIHWRTIDTDHFSIHYGQALEPQAQRAAQYLEEIHQKLSPKMKWKPWGRTQVVLTDNNDDANGFATVLPYNWMQLRVVPPKPEEELSTYDDWLKLLITHEYTHVLHLDQYGGVWHFFRILFGKMASPNGLTPNWVKEGIATYNETAETHGGRGRSTLGAMLIRTAVLKDQFPPIDRADGAHWEWPATKLPYIMGVEFLEYLADTYGEDKIIEFNRRTSRSPWIGAVNRQSKKVFGKSFYKLWDEWHAFLTKKYQAEFAHFEETPSEVLKAPQKKGSLLELPAFSVDGRFLYFVASDPHHATHLWRQEWESGKSEKVLAGGVDALDISPDGKQMVYSKEGAYKRYNRYSDLWIRDLEKKKSRQLTKGLRARDPGFFPDGKRVVFVAHSPLGDALKILTLEDKKTADLYADPADLTQFHNPRVSPDGKGIVVTAFHFQKGWDLFWIRADGQQVRPLTHNGFSIETRAIWSADGKFIYYSSDEDGISNIYRMAFPSGRVEKITQVLTGAFQPALSPDGKTLVVKYYTGKGYELRKMETAKSPLTLPSPSRGEGQGEGDPRTLAPSHSVPSHPYSPFRQPLLLPRYWQPGYLVIDNAILFSFFTGSHDPLLRHNWSAGATYRTDANRFGYYAGYAYQRWRTSLGASFSDTVVNYGNLYGLGNYFEERRGGSIYASYPWLRNRFSLGYGLEERLTRSPVPANALIVPNGGRFGGPTVTYGFGTGTQYPASISVEKGRRILLSTTIYDSLLGGAERNEKQIVYGDWREYLQLGHHHVIALRAAGGYSWGDFVFPRVFTLGGSLGEGVLAGPVSMRYFPLRGLLTPTFSGDRAALFSAEYRLPLFSPQRGLGTWPIFLNDAHWGFFADYGNIWSTTHPNFFSDFLLGVGSEFRLDFVLGHGLPATARLGYGIIVKNRDRLGALTDPYTGGSLKNGTVIFQWGTSF